MYGTEADYGYDEVVRSEIIQEVLDLKRAGVSIEEARLRLEDISANEIIDEIYNEDYN